MKKGTQRLVIFLSLAIAAGTMSWWLRPKEPIYADKPLSFWLNILEDHSPGFKPPAVWKTLGTNEVPVLIKALEHCDRPVIVYSSRLYNLLYHRYWRYVPASLRERLPYSNIEDMGVNAVLLLSSRGNEARPAIPALIHIMKADGSRTLKSMPSLRHHAALCLTYFRQDDKAVTAAFTTLLNDPDAFMRRTAAKALQSRH